MDELIDRYGEPPRTVNNLISVLRHRPGRGDRGEGRNRREENGDATAHAELEAIRDACRRLGSWRLHRCTMYVTLEPCPMCAGGIINARMETVRYGTRDERRGPAARCSTCLRSASTTIPVSPPREVSETSSLFFWAWGG